MNISFLHEITDLIGTEDEETYQWADKVTLFKVQQAEKALAASITQLDSKNKHLELTKTVFLNDIKYADANLKRELNAEYQVLSGITFASDLINAELLIQYYMYIKEYNATNKYIEHIDTDFSSIPSSSSMGNLLHTNLTTIANKLSQNLFEKNKLTLTNYGQAWTVPPQNSTSGLNMPVNTNILEDIGAYLQAEKNMYEQKALFLEAVLQQRIVKKIFETEYQLMEKVTRQVTRKLKDEETIQSEENKTIGAVEKIKQAIIEALRITENNTQESKKPSENKSQPTHQTIELKPTHQTMDMNIKPMDMNIKLTHRQNNLMEMKKEMDSLSNQLL